MCCSIYCAQQRVDRTVAGHHVPHSEESKRKMSASKMGQGLGHPFYRDREKINNTIGANAWKRRKFYALKKCMNTECGIDFQPVSKDPHKKFCTPSCAHADVGRRSLIGERSRGKSPAEGSGRAKWHNYYSPIAGHVRVQGTWELRAAFCFDMCGFNWKPNHGAKRFQYVDEGGREKTYNPDFLVDGVYHEVKGYLSAATQRKMNEVEKEHQLGVTIADWVALKAIEAGIFGKALSGTNTKKSLVQLLSRTSVDVNGIDFFESASAFTAPQYN